MVELAGVRRNTTMPVERILPSNIDAFSKATRTKLKDKDFAKRYLQLTNAIAQMKKGTSKEVPNIMFNWCARSDSNARPLGS